MRKLFQTIYDIVWILIVGHAIMVTVKSIYALIKEAIWAIRNRNR